MSSVTLTEGHQMHTCDALFNEVNKLTNGSQYYFSTLINYVPEKYKPILEAYWQGGAIHHWSILGCLLNGWYEEMKSGMGKRHNAYDSDFRMWMNTRSSRDDGTSQDLFEGIIGNILKKMDEFEAEEKRKRELRKQRKNYKQVKLLKTDIAELAEVLDASGHDVDFIRRVKAAMGIDEKNA